MDEARKRINDMYAMLLQEWLRERGIPLYKQVNGHKSNLLDRPTRRRRLGIGLIQGAR